MTRASIALKSASTFLSTPSSQRATLLHAECRRIIIISIHALFAEGDLEMPDLFPMWEISIHALFAEGDDQEGRALHH